jgi:adenine-specific DNA-methyltransferase
MPKGPIRVETIRHTDASRRNIPTAELESVMHDDEKSPVRVAYERRNRDLDPQIVWRGKDAQDWSELVVNAPPLYIQEKVHPQALIDDLRRMAKAKKQQEAGAQVDLFADFNGLPDKEAATEFYQHDQHWSNRMILGDSLAVMASLAERESLRGKVQCIYFDPPYGIKFNSNFQWSTTSRDVKDGARDHVTREPEQVRAFRDTWKDGIHSYLTYLRDRLTVARDLLHESGSIFVQIGDENVHRVRALMDEVFGEENSCGLITYKKTTGAGSPAIGTNVLAAVKDYIVWFAKNKNQVKYRQPYREKEAGSEGAASYNRVQSPDGMTVKGLRAGEDFGRDYEPRGWRLVSSDNLTSQTGVESTQVAVAHFGETYRPTKGGWKTNALGLSRLGKASRVTQGGIALRYTRGFLDFAVVPLNDDWQDTSTGSFTEEKVYVVQSGTKAVARCLLMTTDPGDLVLDPTCGSGTTAYVAEQWGRRWITIDTSRVSLALARSRLMGARYAYYLLADSPEGQRKEGEITRTAPRTTKTQGNVRHGFVYERVPHVTLKSIANNAEIDTIWEQRQPAVIAALAQLNAALAGHAAPFPVTQGGRAGHKLDFRAKGVMTLPSGEEAPKGALLEWEVPREAPESWPKAAHAALDAFWQARIARQKEIDASIAAKADFEYLYDKPYEDKGKVRVAGPFTVESLSPHRVLAMRDDDELIDVLEASEGKRKAAERDPKVKDFAEMVLENLGVAGVQQQDKKDRIRFTSLTGWPGQYICAEARYNEGEAERRAGIVIGPEFGTFARPALVAAAREAGDAGFDALVACAFNYDAHSSEFNRLGKVPVLKARMNPDLMMGNELKATGAGNLFVVFGEPDIKIHAEGDDQIRVQVFGVDVFKPQTGEVASEGTDGIAVWMIDTDYNEESFFVRQCYFLGANDPYKALKTTLKAEIDEDAWTTLNSDMSRPFAKPASGRIAVKVINHLGDEVMKIFSV